MLTTLLTLTLASAAPLATPRSAAESLANAGRATTYVGLGATGFGAITYAVAPGTVRLHSTGAMAAGGGLFLSGTLMEAVALRRLSNTQTAVGWTGMGLLLGGGALGLGSSAVPTWSDLAWEGPGAIMAGTGIALASVGLVLTVGQFGLNRRNGTRLDSEVRSRTYRGASVTASPWLAPTGGGFVVSGRW